MAARAELVVKDSRADHITAVSIVITDREQSLLMAGPAQLHAGVCHIPNQAILSSPIPNLPLVPSPVPSSHWPIVAALNLSPLSHEAPSDEAAGAVRYGADWPRTDSSSSSTGELDLALLSSGREVSENCRSPVLTPRIRVVMPDMAHSVLLPHIQFSNA